MSIFAYINIETFYYNIWPKCEFDDLLRMRRSSKSGKCLVNDFLQANPHLVPEIEIDESENRNMNKFLQMGIPVSRVFINNRMSGVKYFCHWNGSVSKFLDLYGAKITHLRLTHLGMVPNEAERDFLNRLTSLQSLTVRNWVQVHVPPELLESKFEISNINSAEAFPAVFNQLTNLDIALDENYSHQVYNNVNVTTICFRLLQSLSWPNLRRIALPILPLGLYRNFLLNTEFKTSSNLHALQSISFEHCLLTETDINHTSMVSEVELCAQASASFIKLASLCDRRQIHLEMVNASWFMSSRVLPHIREYDKAIRSLVNLHPSIVSSMEFPNLEQLIISTSTSNVYHIDQIISPTEIAVRPARNRPFWRLLKKVRLFVDSSITNGATEMIPANDNQLDGGNAVLANELLYPSHCPIFLFRYLFKSHILESLKELTIEFKEISDVWYLQQSAANWIAFSCQHVTKLTLTNWTGNTKDMSIVWMGMLGLEELIIRKCRGIDISVFVGEDVSNPSISLLPNLKKLSLFGLEQMTALTDDLFRFVISQMVLTHLYLSSAEPLKNVTAGGIRSLLNGPFANSILKFPFKDWALDGCTSQEFVVLSKEFRSFHMI